MTPRQNAWDKILLAESLRQAGKPFEAYTLFTNVLLQQLTPDPGEILSEAKRRWAQAHCGAAALEAFIPFGDNDYLLDDARTWLEAATRNGKANDYPWALAQLGEVYRNKGNLPALYFDDGRPGVERSALVLGARSSAEEDYKQSEDFFLRAGADAKTGPAWVNAHYGALLINKRRYFKKDDHAQIPQRAHELLQMAAIAQEGANPWTNQYLSGAYFVLAITGFKRRTQDNMVPAGSFVYLSLALEIAMKGWHSAPDLMALPTQPGALTLDCEYAILYDLLDAASEKHDELPREYLDAMTVMLRVLRGPSLKDPRLPGASALRLQYIEMYLEFLGGGIKKEDRLIQDAQKIVNQAIQIRHSTPELKRGKELPADLGNGFLVEVLSVMVSLLKAGVVLTLFCKEESTAVLQEIADELSQYARLLPVLQCKGGQSKNPIEDLIGRVADLYTEKDGNNTWLLFPIWSVANAHVDVLSQVLVLSNQKWE